jgi:hypothetical protein
MVPSHTPENTPTDSPLRQSLPPLLPDYKMIARFFVGSNVKGTNDPVARP